MPIRFRCGVCDKLLGIGRRKAGATVKCPNCGNDIVVPQPEAQPVGVTESATMGETGERGSIPATPVIEKKNRSAQLFENSDFEELLNPVPVGGSEDSRNRNKPRENPPPIPLENRLNPFEVPPVTPKSKAPEGIVISQSKMTWISVAAVVVLALVFTAGLLVGRFLKP